MTDKLVTVSFSIEESQKKQVDELLQTEYRNFSQLMRMLINEYLSNREKQGD
jgi:metal-responsive CopG/Arc/MetJ family transcriptional regulator